MKPAALHLLLSALLLTAVHVYGQAPATSLTGRWIRADRRTGYTISATGFNEFTVNANRVDEAGEDVYDAYAFADTAEVTTPQHFVAWAVQRYVGYRRTTPDSAGRIHQTFPQTTRYKRIDLTQLGPRTLRLTVSRTFTFHNTLTHPVTRSQLAAMRASCNQLRPETSEVLTRFVLKRPIHDAE